MHILSMGINFLLSSRQRTPLLIVFLGMCFPEAGLNLSGKGFASTSQGRGLGRMHAFFLSALLFPPFRFLSFLLSTISLKKRECFPLCFLCLYKSILFRETLLVCLSQESPWEFGYIIFEVETLCLAETKCEASPCCPWIPPSPPLVFSSGSFLLHSLVFRCH